MLWVFGIAVAAMALTEIATAMIHHAPDPPAFPSGGAPIAYSPMPLFANAFAAGLVARYGPLLAVRAEKTVSRFASGATLIAAAVYAALALAAFGFAMAQGAWLAGFLIVAFGVWPTVMLGGAVIGLRLLFRAPGDPKGSA